MKLIPRFSISQLLVVIALAAFALQIAMSGFYAPRAGDVHCVCISPDGKLIATGSEDHSVRLWNMATRRSAILTGHGNLVRSLAFSSDGTMLASGSLDSTVRIWDVMQGKELAKLPGHTCANSVAFSPDGKLLAVGDWGNRSVYIWNVGSKKLQTTLTGHADPVTSVAFSTDGKMLASGSEDKTVKLWDVSAMKVQATLNAGNPVMAIVFSPDDRTIAVAKESGGVAIWSVAKPRELFALEDVAERLTSVSLSPDGRVLATGSATEHIHTIFPGNLRFTRAAVPSFVGVKLWDVAAREPLASHPSPTTVWSVAFSPDGRWLAASGERWTTRVWDVQSGQELPELTARKSRSVLAWYTLGAAVALWLLTKAKGVRATQSQRSRTEFSNNEPSESPS